ncbi:MAG: DNA-binding response regulator [Gammaproteobacteria bacterium]|jgi:FixJ family two-component response regulator|nr:DNA-binding response regulator [Gammaproteobacteria bacterium]
MKPNPIIYIVDDDVALCKSLQWLLESTGYQVRIYHMAEEYLKNFHINLRGCLILDIRMPGMSGLELQTSLASAYNRMPIIILTGHGDIPIAVNAMKRGAFDVITKPFNAQHLLNCVERAMAQDAYHNKERLNADNFLKRLASLSTREKQILEYIVAGKLNKQIAAELDIAVKTVELHRSHLMHKLEVRSLAEVIRLYCLYFLSIYT